MDAQNFKNLSKKLFSWNFGKSPKKFKDNFFLYFTERKFSHIEPQSKVVIEDWHEETLKPSIQKI